MEGSYMDVTPPHSPELEQSVLGAAILHPEAAIEVTAHLKESDFYVPVNAHLFSLICERITRGEEIDSLEIHTEMKRVSDEYGYHVADCITEAAFTHHLAGQMEALKKLANERKVIRTSLLMVARAAAGDSNDIVAEAIDSFMEIDEGLHKAKTIQDLLDERLISTKTPERFFTVPGFDGLHLFGGDLVVIGGRPGTGKTAYALQLALGWADQAKVMFYSYEMTDMQLTDRVIAAHSDRDISQIEDGLTEDEVANIGDMVGASMMTKQLSVRVAAGMSNAELFADMYRFKARGGKVVVIDYLQLAADKSKMGLTHDTTLFSNRLRRVALDSGLLVVAVAQLNRGPADRDAVRMPIVSDLRESGAIEQDATAICLLMAVPNPKYSAKGKEFIEQSLTVNMDFRIADLDAKTGDPDDDYKFVVVNWAKVRQGKERRWAFVFDGAHMKLTPIRRVGGVRITQTPNHEYQFQLHENFMDMTAGE